MEKYILPSGVKVDAEGVVAAMLAGTELPQHYLDTATGALVKIPSLEALGEWVAKIGQSERYFLIPHIEDGERNEIARGFVEEIIASMAAEYLKDARDALAGGGWRSLTQFLKKDTDGFIHAWDQYVYDEAWERVDEWLVNNQRVPIKKAFEGFDDCAICSAMRQADARGRELNEKELRATFTTANLLRTNENTKQLRQSLGNFFECFDAILNGGKEKSRQAARRVRKLVYSSSASGREKYEEIAAIIRTAPENYTRISEDWRQENFVMAISVIYFLHDMEAQPDFLFPWLFQLLQHPNGYIRHAAVKMISHEIGPLTVYIRFPGERSTFKERLKPEQADNILYSLFVSLNQLMATLWQPKYKRYKYIDSLPASPYKSVQMVLAELEESCGKKYIDRLAYSTKPL